MAVLELENAMATLKLPALGLSYHFPVTNPTKTPNGETLVNTGHKYSSPLGARRREHTLCPFVLPWFSSSLLLFSARQPSDLLAFYRQQPLNFTPSFLFPQDRHFSMVEYHVPVSAGGVANIFDLLEASKAAFNIRHFSVSQTTLEEVRN